MHALSCLKFLHIGRAENGVRIFAGVDYCHSEPIGFTLIHCGGNKHLTYSEFTKYVLKEKLPQHGVRKWKNNITTT